MTQQVRADELLAQRSRNQLREDGAMLAPGECITLRFGIAPVAHLAQLAHALTFADGRLYAARQAGRDRVHVALSIWATLPGV